MKKLTVDMDDLLDAMTESDQSLMRHFLDLETGSVQMDLQYADELTELEQADLKPQPNIYDTERYVGVPMVPTREQFVWMERFVETIEERDVADKLAIALNGKGAFRRFRDTLSVWPDLEHAWHVARRNALLSEALKWLDSIEIDPVYELRAMPPPASLQPPKAKTPAIKLLDVLLLGAPDGKTQVIDGTVLRVAQAHTPSEARGLFKSLCREWCEMRGEGWRNRFIEGKNEFALRELKIRVSDTTVEVEVSVSTLALR